MATPPQSKFLLMAGVGVIAAVLAYTVLNAPDRRTPGEKIGDAIDQLDDRTPGERLKDSIQK
jgi:hypothetical protein